MKQEKCLQVNLTNPVLTHTKKPFWTNSHATFIITAEENK